VAGSCVHRGKLRLDCRERVQGQAQQTVECLADRRRWMSAPPLHAESRFRALATHLPGCIGRRLCSAGQLCVLDNDWHVEAPREASSRLQQPCGLPGACGTAHFCPPFAGAPDGGTPACCGHLGQHDAPWPVIQASQVGCRNPSSSATNKHQIERPACGAVGSCCGVVRWGRRMYVSFIGQCLAPACLCLS